VSFSEETASSKNSGTIYLLIALELSAKHKVEDDERKREKKWNKEGRRQRERENRGEKAEERITMEKSNIRVNSKWS